MKNSHKVITINRKEGKYTILYGMHIKSQDPADIPDDTDAVVLETGTADYLIDPIKKVNSLKDHVQYKELVKQLEQKKIPLIFLDVKYRFNDYALLMADNALASVEWMQGFKMMKDKKGGKGERAVKIAAASWLLLPFAANMFRLFSTITGKGMSQSGKLKRLSHKLHPETDLLYLTLRNALIAEKEVFLAKELGNKPHIVTVLGAGHVGIEDMIAMDDRKRSLNIKSLLPLLKKVAKPEYLYTSVHFHFNGENWEVKEIVEMPELKKLLRN